MNPLKPNYNGKGASYKFHIISTGEDMFLGIYLNSKVKQ